MRWEVLKSADDVFYARQLSGLVVVRVLEAKQNSISRVVLLTQIRDYVKSEEVLVVLVESQAVFAKRLDPAVFIQEAVHRKDDGFDLGVTVILKEIDLLSEVHHIQARIPAYWSMTVILFIVEPPSIGRRHSRY